MLSNFKLPIQGAFKYNKLSFIFKKVKNIGFEQFKKVLAFFKIKDIEKKILYF